jgi:hypothetical protein
MKRTLEKKDTYVTVMILHNHRTLTVRSKDVLLPEDAQDQLLKEVTKEIQYLYGRETLPRTYKRGRTL